MQNRVGLGFDAHAFAAGRKLILGGVEVTHQRGLEGHSDADVLVHALMDAMLGACGDTDIGTHFPDTDPAYSGISSLVLLEEVAGILRDKGYRVVNADCVVVAQEPRLSPYIDLMRERIAKTMRIDAARVAVKATTTEGMGFTGRGEGIAAIATVLLETD
ncbi:MAG: 2-C-methyl-D-erythritol 2,4-cyclodiphosphate synthase [Actinomycetota bacterium]|nr:2-C-methyl-D-erythritol 2,4-cyclodiphosphate synthase [Actinomycetota bacterium]MDD5666131.1 2-C-methyl-D-erythritol 2,4-cyclodiphosphate synthase [Actinomycetota bacterium]